MTDPAALPTALTAVPASAAPRLRRIEVTDFRAFPKDHPGVFDLGVGGCNLLAFGENGSGKSSLYRALRDLFSTKPREIVAHRNVFTDGPAPRVRVTLDDGAVFDWTTAGHPTAQVVDIARRSSFLTHTALRELIYNQQGPDEPNNIFEDAIKRLIGDFDATLEGGIRRSVAELWGEVTAAFEARVTVSGKSRRPQHYIATVQTACARFNDGMRQALDRLEVEAKRLLRLLLDALAVDPLDLIGLTFPQLTYDETQRKILNQSLVAKIRVRTHDVVAPQSFLNEGRQTALALALYLAGRKVCAPPGREHLKLLVMDDLLISLDASHRRPVLDLILSEFEDWQIILLTHDRYWFQLAREQVAATGMWKSIEIFERYDGELLTPFVRDLSPDMVEALLVQAEKFLADNHSAAACNYARSACEAIFERYCVKNRITFKLPIDGPRRPPLNELLQKVKNEVKNDTPRLNALKQLEPHKRFVLNPFSHDPAVPVPAADVQAAINAVREAARACGNVYP